MQLKSSKIKAVAFLTALALLTAGAYIFVQSTGAAGSPTTGLAANPPAPDGDNGWYRTNPVISLAADTDSTTYYSWDGTAAMAIYAAPFKVPSAGSHTLYYYSAGASGTPEPMNKRSFKLDATAPQLTVGAPKPKSHIRRTVTVGVDAADPKAAAGSSGVAEVKVYVGRAQLASQPAGPLSVVVDTKKLKPGRRLLKMIAKDKAGNIARVYRAYFVDNTKPKVPTAYFSPSLPAAGEQASLWLMVRDAVAPRMDVTVRIRNAGGKLLSEAALGKVSREELSSVALKMPKAEGIYSYRIIAVDKAGNRRVRRGDFQVGNYWILDNVKAHVFELSKNIGVRVEGTDGEHRGADYLEGKLRGYGYAVDRQSFALPDGKVSYNIVARRAGRDATRQFVVGAHYDSKSPSPGANDNATGTGVVLELARLFKTKSLGPTMVFVLFGAEERFGVNRYPEHQGSRHFVNSMGADERRRTVGMISVDMVGVGSTFHVRSMRTGPMSLVNELLAQGQRTGTAISYAQDFGWSDHDQFELAGIPAAWLEWRNDSLFHTTRDAFERIQWDAVDITGNFLSKFLLQMER